ncbi:DUF3805 domain-containing protein [uncultured Bacteroides sp.]|uniref:DUF3805 domain-containing protein n=1 Tax=uncultured Bacteroides sp. TaxID=162156 RepID=UPI002AABB7CE|nr:DUF3805 domain-containing protein [uncultured Bacteroides sp.]
MTQKNNKFISPGAWFSMIYPSDWNEFEDGEGSFLFYNPDKWTGNFRISAYKADPNLPNSKMYGQESVSQELAENPSATVAKVGDLKCAYTKTVLKENESSYVVHLWIVGIDDITFECSFTLPLDKTSVKEAEDIIASLKVRDLDKKYPAELIPVRLIEIHQINEGFEWVALTVKTTLKKDFKGVEDDLSKLQEMIEKDSLGKKQKANSIAYGIAICVILANEIDGFAWKTLIDGNREVPVLQYKDSETVIDPMKFVWSKVKRGESCNVITEYVRIIEEIGK